MPQKIDRRDFLRLAGLGGGAAVLGALGPGGRVAAARGATVPALARSPHRSSVAAADAAARILVVLEMAGGNDGASMAPPADLDVLRSLRPSSSHPEDQLLRPGNDVILHPALERLQHRALTIVDGVGSPAPDLSHFEMLRRWWAGDPEGRASQATGFLGRLCDAVDGGAPVTGLSVGGSSSPALVSERAGTLGLPQLWWLWWLGADADSWEGAFRDSLAAMGTPADSDTATLALARSGVAAGLGLADMVGALPEDGVATNGYPESGLAESLALAAQILDADLGVRIVHVPVDGDFDTHETHLDRHDTLMAELDGALDAFLLDLESLGLADRVLVATTSEFGRRAEENGDGGLDHGTASTMLLAGPVGRGRIGEPSDYRQLDDDGNVTAAIPFDRYFATLAEWVGVAPSDVLPGNPTPLEGVW